MRFRVENSLFRTTYPELTVMIGQRACLVSPLIHIYACRLQQRARWKHAASCYQDTPVEGEERQYYEHDAVFAVMEGYHVPV